MNKSYLKVVTRLSIPGVTLVVLLIGSVFIFLPENHTIIDYVIDFFGISGLVVLVYAATFFFHNLSDTFDASKYTDIYKRRQAVKHEVNKRIRTSIKKLPKNVLSFFLMAVGVLAVLIVAQVIALEIGFSIYEVPRWVLLSIVAVAILGWIGWVSFFGPPQPVIKEKLKFLSKDEKIALELERILGTPETPEGMVFSATPSDAEIDENIYKIIQAIQAGSMPTLDSYVDYNLERSNYEVKDLKKMNNRQRARLMFEGTPVLDMLSNARPIAIPEDSRIWHCLVLGSPGAGKTQLLQYMIRSDMKHGHPLIIIDSQDKMIPNIQERQRCVTIDPMIYTPAFNLFDLSKDMLEFVISGIMKAEITPLQKTALDFLSQLMKTIEFTTLSNLRKIVQYKEVGKKYYSKHPNEELRDYFDTQFYANIQTHKAIVHRIYMLSRDENLKRIFNSPVTKINFSELMKEGKTVVINTAEKRLGADASKIFGRFMIALIWEAIKDRTGKRYYVYVDEAHEYLDETIGTALVKSRKENVGWILATQDIEQIRKAGLFSAFMATGVKLVGSVIDQDAREMARQMKIDKIPPLRYKDWVGADWWLYVRHKLNYKAWVPFGTLEDTAKIDPDEVEWLLEKSKKLYGVTPGDKKPPKPTKDDKKQSVDDWGE